MIGKDVTVPVSMTSEDGRVPLIKTGEDGTLPPSVSAEGFTSKAGNEWGPRLFANAMPCSTGWPLSLPAAICPFAAALAGFSRFRVGVRFFGDVVANVKDLFVIILVSGIDWCAMSSMYADFWGNWNAWYTIGVVGLAMSTAFASTCRPLASQFGIIIFSLTEVLAAWSSLTLLALAKRLRLRTAIAARRCSPL